MKKLSELMDELGFDPEGSPAVKEAFVKYLIKSTEGISVLTPTEKELIKASPTTVKALKLPPEQNQLQFDFMDYPDQRTVKRPKSS